MNNEITMEWINVQKKLPKDNEEVLILVEDYFFDKDNILRQRKSLKIFQGYFCRETGWFKPDYNNNATGLVKFWMPLPLPPEEKQ